MNAQKSQAFLSADEIRARLAGACAGIAGCGGLGSNAAVMLARAGIGRLILADDDRVESSNLDRQYYFSRHTGRIKAEALAEVIRETGFGTQVEVHAVRVDMENVYALFSDAAVIVEAFDGVASKSMMLHAFADERFQRKWLVAASGLAGYGSSNAIRTVQLSPRIYLCGDQQTDVAVEGVLSPRVTLAAAHEANMVIRLLCGELMP